VTTSIIAYRKNLSGQAFPHTPRGMVIIACHRVSVHACTLGPQRAHAPAAQSTAQSQLRSTATVWQLQAKGDGGSRGWHAGFHPVTYRSNIAATGLAASLSVAA